MNFSCQWQEIYHEPGQINNDINLTIMNRDILDRISPESGFSPIILNGLGGQSEDPCLQHRRTEFLHRVSLLIGG